MSLRKAIQKAKCSKPTFEGIMKIWQVVYYSNACNMVAFHKDTNLHLFLASNKSRDNTYSMIYRENNFQFKFLMEEETCRISIEVDRAVDRTSVKENISYNVDYEPMELIEQEKMRFIENCLRSGVIELMKYCYENKRF